MFWDGGGGVFLRVLPITVLAMAVLIGSSFANLTHSRAQNRLLQRAISHDHLTFVLDGVRERAIHSVQPDPIMLVHFPEINHQLKVSFFYYFDEIYCYTFFTPCLRLLELIVV